ncbi:STAS domain-containing protein [Actinoplanes sp. CA-051413]|uniref:STAS domain-containing protein n=1 Tax=Actinoplanes sp. CA-051413 TaxID=3239899 RepID=UPI003D99D50D
MERQSEVLAGCEAVWSAGWIAVSGAIDAANAPVVGHRMRALVGPGELHVDCRSVTFLDAAGLRMLAEVGATAHAEGATVCLQCSPAVTEMLTLCGVRELPGVTLKHASHDSPGSRQ